jgi:hypothetical protein
MRIMSETLFGLIYVGLGAFFLIFHKRCARGAWKYGQKLGGSVSETVLRALYVLGGIIAIIIGMLFILGQIHFSGGKITSSSQQFP